MARHGHPHPDEFGRGRPNPDRSRRQSRSRKAIDCSPPAGTTKRGDATRHWPARTVCPLIGRNIGRTAGWSRWRAGSIFGRSRRESGTRSQRKSASIQRLTPNIWYGEYLRNKVAEVRRSGRRPLAKSDNLVVRGSAPDESQSQPEPESRRFPRLFGKSRAVATAQPDATPVAASPSATARASPEPAWRFVAASELTLGSRRRPGDRSRVDRKWAGRPISACARRRGQSRRQ